MIYIVDAYNVMHALEEGEIRREDLEERRRSFVESLVSYSALVGSEIVCVFDSRHSPTSQSEPVPGTGVTVLFASAAESADIVIGRLVQQYLGTSEGRIRVVSADWEVQKGALQPRVERMPPRNFLSEMKNFEKRLAKSSEMGRMPRKLEDKLDVETLRKLERMRRQKD